MGSTALLELKELSTYFFTERGQVQAIDRVSFHIDKGEILGIVGESGCGKSVTAQSILRLYDEKELVYYEGDILFQGESLLKKNLSEIQSVRGKNIAMIFQDPLSSLNPLFTIGNQIIEAIMLHQKISKKEALEKAIEMLKITGISSPDKRIYEYPHMLSGGMRQRAMIAMALACQPQLLIADEPSTALDVTIQAQIMNLIIDLKELLDMAVIIITHDLGVIAEVCSRVVVMYLGQIVEESDVESLFTSPWHPYTYALMQSIPTLDGDRTKKLYVIKGIVPSLYNIPKGCRFAPRCIYADQLCNTQVPDLIQEKETNRRVRCWHYDWIRKGKEDLHGTNKDVT